MRHCLLLLAAILALGGLSPKDVWADRNVAIFSIEISGDGPAELRTQLLKRLEEGVKLSGHQVTTLEALVAALADAPELVGCTSSTCLSRIRDIVGADQFVRASVEARGAAYSIKLELLEPAHDETVIRVVTEACEVCTIPELNELARESSKKLFIEEAAKYKVMLISKPAGAEIEIDGEPAGPSPQERELTEGEHSIVARLPSHSDTKELIRVGTSSEMQRFELELVANPAIKTTRSRPFKTWKWIAAAGSVAAIGTGITLWAIDGGTCSPAQPAQCPEIRHTKTGGILTLVAGSALGAASAWMFYKDRSQAEKGPIAGATLTDRGAMGTLLLRF